MHQPIELRPLCSDLPPHLVSAIALPPSRSLDSGARGRLIRMLWPVAQTVG